MGLPALSTVCMYMCCEALALFRAKNRKQQSEENQDKTKRIEQTRHSDRVGTSNAFQTSSERVHDVRMSPSQSGTELYVSVVPYTSFNYGGLNNISYLAKTNCQSYTLQLTTRQILNL